MQGYGTVRFTTKEDAEKAIADFHATDLEGRALAVKIDKCAPLSSSPAKHTPCASLLASWPAAVTFYLCCLTKSVRLACRGTSSQRDWPWNILQRLKYPLKQSCC